MNDLKFEKYLPSEFDDYFKIVSDDEVMKYITGKGLSVSQAKTKFDSLMELNQKEEKLGYFKVSLDSNHIGSSKVERYRKDESLFEIGYILNKEFWGKGLATKIAQEMIRRAHQVDDSKDIIGIIDPENTGSRKILEKLGFQTYFKGIEDNMETEKLILRKF